MCLVFRHAGGMTADVMSQAASVVLTHGLHSSGGRSLTINTITVFLGTSEAPGEKRGATVTVQIQCVQWFVVHL